MHMKLEIAVAYKHSILEHTYTFLFNIIDSEYTSQLCTNFKYDQTRDISLLESSSIYYWMQDLFYNKYGRNIVKEIFKVIEKIDNNEIVDFPVQIEEIKK